MSDSTEARCPTTQSLQCVLWKEQSQRRKAGQEPRFSGFSAPTHPATWRRGGRCRRPSPAIRRPYKPGKRRYPERVSRSSSSAGLGRLESAREKRCPAPSCTPSPNAVSITRPASCDSSPPGPVISSGSRPSSASSSAPAGNSSARRSASPSGSTSRIGFSSGWSTGCPLPARPPRPLAASPSGLHGSRPRRQTAVSVTPTSHRTSDRPAQGGRSQLVRASVSSQTPPFGREGTR